MSDDEKLSTTLPGTVEKIIVADVSGQPEKVQISVKGADHLYHEIRIENDLINAAGEAVRLRPGAEVEVTIRADEKDTMKKPEEAAS